MNYAPAIYRAAAGRGPLPVLSDLLTGSPSDLGRGMHALKGTTALRRLCHAEFARRLRGVLRAGYARQDWLDARPLALNGIDVGGAGSIEGPHGREFVTVEFASCKGWDNNVVPPAVMSAALAKAWLNGCEYARLVFVNQNSLDWSIWSISSPYPGSDEQVLGAVRASTEAFAAAYDGLQGSDPRGLSSYPISYDRLLPDENRMAVLIKDLADRESAATRRGGVISPSEISITNCDRRIGYHLTRTERRSLFSTQLYRVFGYGHAIHDVVQGLMAEEFPEFEVEAKISNPALNIQGSADIGSDDTCFEIKSMSTHQIQKLRKEKDEHKRQATVYARASGKYSTVVYLYIDKDTYEIKEFATKADAEVWHRIVERAERINAAVRAGDLPARTTNPSDCSECPFIWTCLPEKDPNAEPTVLRVHRESQQARRST